MRSVSKACSSGSGGGNGGSDSGDNGGSSSNIVEMNSTPVANVASADPAAAQLDQVRAFAYCLNPRTL